MPDPDTATIPAPPPYEMPDRRTRAKIGARADVDERTIHRFCVGDGKRHPVLDEKIREAFAHYGVTPPPTPSK